MTDPTQVQIMPADGSEIVLPSGLVVTSQDVVLNAPGGNGPATRFRFLAPAIAREGGSVDFETASADMAHLCKTYALPKLVELGVEGGQVIVSFADRDVPFGEADPAATQFFEAYRVEGDACIWEAF